MTSKLGWSREDHDKEAAKNEPPDLSAEKYWKRYFEWKELARMDDTDTHFSPGEVCRFAEAYAAYRESAPRREK